ncbi:MAG: L-2-amino-thiazoline-4-carboxylic acid hydrolase [Candidatus Heimdallarchaeota archaeon]|nr:L-2-amino-thiazoline-4-carboxylic acid hydrolase [Candidatus Heimdallarchaeota archaeon]
MSIVLLVGMMDYSYKKKLVYKRLNSSVIIAREVLSQYYDSEKIDSILVDTINEVEQLLPQVPFIGSKKENIHLNDFFDSILVLALYKTLQKEGATARDVGKYMYEIRKIQASKQSKIYRILYSKLLFSSFIKNNLKKKNTLLNQKAFSENWKMEFIDGDGVEFDWGMDFSECAVKKFYDEHEGGELLPYVCMSDYAMFEYLKNVEFIRTQTMGGGAPCCDFRFKKGGSTSSGWPPEEREDFIYKK